MTMRTNCVRRTNCVQRTNLVRRTITSRFFLALVCGILLAATMAAGSAAASGDAVPAEPITYAQVIGNSAAVYASPSDAADGLPPETVYGAGFIWFSLASADPIVQDNQLWYQVRPNGYVPADELRIFAPSQFQGIALTDTPDKPIAWIVYGTRVSPAPGVPAPANAPRLAKYTAVTILQEQQVGDWKWYRIGDNQWVEQRQVGVVKPSPRPADIGASDKWIEVNLYEQTLAAYEGDRMVYATLVSSGLPQWPTRPGLFHIWAKVRSDKMSGAEGYPDYYYLNDVPWIMYFDQAIALHGAYWHDRFGAPHSHGCVNLAPSDAQWLFDWATPVADSANWTLSSSENPGTWVWVH